MIDPQLIDKSRSAVKYTLLFKTLSQVCGGIAMILIVRALTEAEYGIYNLLYSVISLFGMLASLGICNSLQRYIPEYYQKGEFTIAHTLYRTATVLRLITNTILVGLILLFWEMISPALHLDDYKAYFMLFTLVIFLDMQRAMLDICLSSFFLQKYAKAIGCLFPIIKILGYTAVILSGKGIWYAIVTDLTAYAAVFTGLQLLYFKKIPTYQGQLTAFPPDEKQRVVRYALFYNLNDAGDGLLNSYFDNFIIALFMNPAAVGAYSFCVTITVILGRLFPVKYFKEVIQPAFFSANVSDPETNNARFFFQNCIKINSVFTVPCFFFLLLYSHDIIFLFFDGKFAGSVYTLCTVFFFFEVLSFPAGLVAQLREKANIVLFSKIFAVYNLLADLALIPIFGIWGAALATGTAVLGKNLFIWYFIRKDAPFKGLESFCLKLGCFWLGAAGGFSLLNAWITPVWAKVAIGGLGFALAFVLQFQINLFTDREKTAWQAFAGQNPKLCAILRGMKILPASQECPGQTE